MSLLDNSTQLVYTPGLIMDGSSINTHSTAMAHDIDYAPIFTGGETCNHTSENLQLQAHPDT